MKIHEWFKSFHLLEFPEEGESPVRYRLLRRNMLILMLLTTIVPLFFMAVVNYYQYQNALKDEIVNPLRVLVNKTKHSFELFLAQRLSTVSFIASAYPLEELADENALNRIFRVMRQEFGGFIDIGLIDERGIQISYVGPYDLKGKDYTEQSWYHEVVIRGTYVSDVFMGYRKFPHLVLAVQRRTDAGKTWILRATIDTEKFNDLIASMQLDPRSDAFLLNKSGILQTPSRWYGGILDQFPMPLPPFSTEANVVQMRDSHGQDVLVTYTYFVNSPYILAVVKHEGEVLRAWYTLKTEIFFIFVFSVVVIVLVILKLTEVMVRRMQESDEKREAAFRQMEHTHKLSSIGRLAAGVAHEINNPLAIINEKAGLMMDLLEYSKDFPEKQKFTSLTDVILQSINRCRSITHRLLGFARRMEVQIEVLDLNEVLQETFTFLEKEALYRNLDVRLQLAPDLPRIASDRGQLQQVFLNLLNNSYAAVEDGGAVTVTSYEKDLDTVAVSIQDNGCGMSEETIKHIFEPFFTTKKGTGTGLGLPITYGIIKKLGGEIEVQSKEGKGTTMTVYLPKKPKNGVGA
ncbi:PAS domain-containing sensor histidine kinase [Desulforhabdus sp. TSK]|uniref:sensor histidine kinase n=1 Tax=Desulforhabdus sp. TSK TaxID=2925014 RepID=UPI001FC8C4FC|nr:PAS domain-containing sensor histidine kinase [Desulforhabdus sp. TSK]GKT08858.1 two-component sensor histidine kinase [Desulforhabdus sp. TSK]